MTPDPYVRAQGLVLAFILVGTGTAGVRAIAAIGSVITLLVFVRLVRAYRRRRKLFVAPNTPAVIERADLDRLMAHVAALVILAGPCGIAVGIGLGVENSADASVVAGFTSAVLIAGGIYWSSLVDWYWVLPRISGLMGHRACRGRPDSGGAAVSWEGVTRWWLVHRIASAIAVSVGATGLSASLAAGVAAAAGATSVGQAMAAAVVAFVTAGIAVYRQYAAFAFPLAMRPEVYVGVAYKDRELGVVWPVDASLEGLGVVTADDHRARHLAFQLGEGPQFFSRKSDATVPLGEVVARRVGSASLCCSPGSCSGMNWYCIQNDLAWRKPEGS